MAAPFPRRHFLSSAVAAGVGFCSAQSWAKPHVEESWFIRAHVNQVGYLPDEPKRTVVTTTEPLTSPTFHVVEEKTAVVRYAGELTPVHHAKSRAQDWIADFSVFRRPGRYRIRLAGGTLSPPFGIGAAIYADLFPMMESYFGIQQCGPQSSPLRKPCHLDDGIIRGGPRDGQPFDATGGWHDAGDYLKFVETTSYAVALLLLACDLHPQLVTDRAGTSPLSPLLIQAKVGLDWLLKMHPTPHEFYYQVGDKNDHNRWRLPENDSKEALKSWHVRPVFFGIGANLAGRTTAAFAMASRRYKRADPAFAARCLSAAQTVFALGLKHPHPISTEPHEFYPEDSGDDDMEWGAAELYRATRNPYYLRKALAFAEEVDVAAEHASVYTTNALAHFALYPHVTGEDRATLLGYLQSDADRMRRQMHGAYGLATPYVWGTAEAATGVALTCLLYAKLSGDKSAADVARRQRDYILGCNPFGLSCLIGVGARFPQSPHHQIAALDKFQLNGGMIAGPTSLEVFEQQDFHAKNLEYSVPFKQVSSRDSAEVGVYQDSARNFVTNEPAIDYTAQFLLLSTLYLPTK
ncbi:MAG: glycoside hydrolase family 9 [Chthonomonadaceae bacterium]|nr:glycoside hydrolase family 9 [Chthonomonadaceae bacterium]